MEALWPDLKRVICTPRLGWTSPQAKTTRRPPNRDRQRRHRRQSPKRAAENSSRHFEISRKEREAILTHMFPLGPVPTNREGWIISFADKICAVMEVCNVAIALARHNRVVVVSAAM